MKTNLNLNLNNNKTHTSSHKHKHKPDTIYYLNLNLNLNLTSMMIIKKYQLHPLTPTTNIYNNIVYIYILIIVYYHNMIYK